jgi:hypothetical protein
MYEIFQRLKYMIFCVESNQISFVLVKLCQNNECSWFQFYDNSKLDPFDSVDLHHQKYVNKRSRKPKGQSRMDNPETQVTFGTRHEM